MVNKITVHASDLGSGCLSAPTILSKSRDRKPSKQRVIEVTLISRLKFHKALISTHGATSGKSSESTTVVNRSLDRQMARLKKANFRERTIRLQVRELPPGWLPLSRFDFCHDLYSGQLTSPHSKNCVTSLITKAMYVTLESVFSCTQPFRVNL